MGTTETSPRTGSVPTWGPRPRKPAGPLGWLNFGGPTKWWFYRFSKKNPQKGGTLNKNNRHTSKFVTPKDGGGGIDTFLQHSSARSASRALPRGPAAAAAPAHSLAKLGGPAGPAGPATPGHLHSMRVKSCFVKCLASLGSIPAFSRVP